MRAIIALKSNHEETVDDLLDGVLCAYLAYCYWHWEMTADGSSAIWRPVVSPSKVLLEGLPPTADW
jgi:hypothetical protein